MIDSTNYPDHKAKIDRVERTIRDHKLLCLEALNRPGEVVTAREDLHPWLKTVDVNDLPTSMEKLQVVSQYVDDLSQAGQVSNLLQWQRKIYDAQKTLGGAKDPKSLGGLFRLSQAIEREEGVEAAIPYQKDLVELADEALGEEHRNAMTAKSNLAFGYYSLGRFKEAIKHFSELHDLYRRTGFKENALNARMKIAQSQLFLGQEKQALDALQQVVKQAESDPEIDPESRVPTSAKYDLFIAQLENGQIDQTIATMNEEVELKNMHDDPGQHLRHFILSLIHI